MTKPKDIKDTDINQVPHFHSVLNDLGGSQS